MEWLLLWFFMNSLLKRHSGGFIVLWFEGKEMSFSWKLMYQVKRPMWRLMTHLVEEKGSKNIIKGNGFRLKVIWNSFKNNLNCLQVFFSMLVKIVPLTPIAVSIDWLEGEKWSISSESVQVIRPFPAMVWSTKNLPITKKKWSYWSGDHLIDQTDKLEWDGPSTRKWCCENHKILLQTGGTGGNLQYQNGAATP